MPRTMLPRWVLGVLPAAALTGAVAAPAAGVPAGGAPVVAVHRFTSDDTGATYLLWRTIAGAGDTATMTVKLRAVAPGATALGPTRTVAVDPAGMPLGGRLNGNDS